MPAGLGAYLWVIPSIPVGPVGSDPMSETGAAEALSLRARTGGSTRVTVSHRGNATAVTVIIAPADPRRELLTADGADLAAAADHALRRQVPLVIEMTTAGASADEGVAALDGWGRAARAIVSCSGTVPVLLVLTGPTTAGVSLISGLADIVIMTADAYAFVSGPHMVAEFTGVAIGNHELGGTGVHSRTCVASQSPRTHRLLDTFRHRGEARRPRCAARDVDSLRC